MWDFFFFLFFRLFALHFFEGEMLKFVVEILVFVFLAVVSNGWLSTTTWVSLFRTQQRLLMKGLSRCKKTGLTRRNIILFSIHRIVKLIMKSFVNWNFIHWGTISSNTRKNIIILRRLICINIGYNIDELFSFLLQF